MPVISGNTSGSIRSVALEIPCNVKWIGLRDKGSGSNVDLAIVVSGREIYFKRVVLAANASSDTLVDIRVLAGSQILVVTNNEIDYYFTLE